MDTSSKRHFNGAAISQKELDEKLFKAAQEGRTRDIEYILGAGGNPKAVDDYKWTPLHLAAHGGHDDAVRTLLLAGASLSARTDLGNRPEDLARKAKNISTEKILKDYDRRLETLLLRWGTTPVVKNKAP